MKAECDYRLLWKTLWESGRIGILALLVAVSPLLIFRYFNPVFGMIVGIAAFLGWLLCGLTEKMPTAKRIVWILGTLMIGFMVLCEFMMLPVIL